MTIEFLISTTDRTDLSFLNNIFQYIDLKDCKVLIINQCINIPVLELNHRNHNIRCISVKEKGLSKSRNLALENAQGEFCVIADDDVVYMPNCIEIITKTFKNNNSGIYTFQILTPEGSNYKNYKKKSFRIKYPIQKMKVSSIEIVLHRKSVIDTNCNFNEQLGLGAKYPGAEEIIFIHDCVKNGLNVRFIPIPIVIHQKESSSIYFTVNKVKSNGILFAKLFPFTFLLVDVYFTFKRYPRYKKEMSLLRHLYSLFQGNILELTNKV